MASVPQKPIEPARTPTGLRVLAVPAVVVALVAGLWLFAGVLAPGGITGSIVVGIAWFAVASVVLGRLTGARPDLRPFVRGALFATAVAVGGYTAWTMLHDDEVNETVVTGRPAAKPAGAAGGRPGRRPRERAARNPPAGNVQLASGKFEALEHAARGRAAVVELAMGGRRLTLTDFEVDNGPDLRVYLVAGNPRDDGDVTDFEDLGALKGNKGNQQYTIPEGLDTDRYSTVMIWCRAFTVGFARAPLERS